MGGIFGSKRPTVIEPVAPAAPVEEATFQTGAGEKYTRTKKKKMGKKRLQIPLGSTTTATTGTGVSTVVH